MHMHKLYYNTLLTNLTEINIIIIKNILYEQIQRILYQFQNQHEK